MAHYILLSRFSSDANSSPVPPSEARSPYPPRCSQSWLSSGCVLDSFSRLEAPQAGQRPSQLWATQILEKGKGDSWQSCGRLEPSTEGAPPPQPPSHPKPHSLGACFALTAEEMTGKTKPYEYRKKTKEGF